MALNAQSRSLTPRTGRGRDSAVVEKRLVWLALMLATAAAAALRLPLLGHQSLWFDEIFTRQIVGEPTLAGVWNHVKATESTPPLYYVLAWLGDGRSAASMRLIPACALIAAVPVSFLAVRRLVGEWGAAATAVIVAVSPELVQYSMDARAYGLFVLTALLSVWGFSSVLDRDSWHRYLAWAAASVACVWTHYFGIFLVAAEVILLVLVRPTARKATVGWSGVVAVCSMPLIPLLLGQAGDERAAFIAGIPLSSRLVDTVRQLAMGANVPRTWLEGAGLAVAVTAIAVGVVLAMRSGERPRVLLALAALAFVMPLVLAAAGIEDRLYNRNLVFVLPVAATIAAPALLRLRAIPLILYVGLSILTSVWVATNWRYEQLDWRSAVARSKAIDGTAALIAATKFGAPVVQTYDDHAPIASRIFVRSAWVMIEPYRAAHHRALGPAPLPSDASPILSRFTPVRELTVHGFRLILVKANRPLPIDPGNLGGLAMFPP